MYEDWSAGRITEYNFMLSEKYQGEQLELDVKIERLHEMEVDIMNSCDAEKWIGLMKGMSIQRIDG